MNRPLERFAMNDVYWRAKFGFSRGEEAKGLAVLQLPFLIT